MHEKESQAHLSARLAEATKQVVVGARYMHYKQLSYKVIAVALREEDNEPCVIYQAEYGDELTWIRPVANWVEDVEVDGKEVKRFSRIEEDMFEDDSNKVRDSLLTQGAQLTDKIDQLERKTTDHTAYYGYLKDFLINSGCLCDDNLQAAFNDAVLLAMIGTRVLLEDTINAHYLKSREGDTARMAVASDWFKISNDPAAYKNKLDGKSVAKRAADANDRDVKLLHDGEYADFCSYTHSTAQRTVLNIPAHRTLAARKTVVVSIKAYANTLTCIAEIVGDTAPKKLIDEVVAYFDKYRDNVMEATLNID